MKKSIVLPILFLFAAFSFSCKEASSTAAKVTIDSQISSKEMALEVMQKHLDAISNRDLKTLESTLSPEENMQLILPGTEIIEKTSGFIDYHREWFKTTNWTIDSKILNSEVGESLATTVVESVYKEPKRDGKPYFNRMHVSYVLKKIDNKWFVIKDHMASVQKSTDIK